MKKMLAWRSSEQMEGPKVGCAAPALPNFFNTLASSPLSDSTANILPGFGGPSAFSLVSATGAIESPSGSPLGDFSAGSPLSDFCAGSPLGDFALSQPLLAAASNQIYNQLMCLPAILDSLGPSLKAQMTTTQFKPIPNHEKVDLAGWRMRDPADWGMDDVAGWMLDVTKRHRIPCEDINMMKFATLKGSDLLKMTEEDFRNCDYTYGSLFFKEMATMHKSADDKLIDDVLRKYKENEEEAAVQLQKLQRQQQQQMQNILAAQQLSQTIANNIQAQSLVAAQNLANNLCAALSPNLSNTLTSTANLLHHQLTQKLSPQSQDYLNCFQPGPSTSNEYDDSDPDTKLGLHKTRDGKMRKRSQHAKGNKLWEFIRDALKDPATCPSVVRWEDPVEGVFRIVESEKLARLWGERKNNQKMTYEKLSRAMRTYYDKQILVPVPKTGLYPKKLVYKFGPGAAWCQIKSETVSA